MELGNYDLKNFKKLFSANEKICVPFFKDHIRGVKRNISSSLMI